MSPTSTAYWVKRFEAVGANVAEYRKSTGMDAAATASNPLQKAGDDDGEEKRGERQLQRRGHVREDQSQGRFAEDFDRLKGANH